MTAPSPRLRTAWRVGSALAAAAGSAVVTSALVNRSRHRSQRKQASERAGEAPTPTPVTGAAATGEIPGTARPSLSPADRAGDVPAPAHPAAPATAEPGSGSGSGSGFARSDDLARAIEAADAVEAAPAAWARVASELRARTTAAGSSWAPSIAGLPVTAEPPVPSGPPTPAAGTAAAAGGTAPPADPEARRNGVAATATTAGTGTPLTADDGGRQVGSAPAAPGTPGSDDGVTPDRRLLLFVGVAVAVAVLLGLGVVVLGGASGDGDREQADAAGTADAAPTSDDATGGGSGSRPATTPVDQLSPAQAFAQAGQRLQAAGTFAYEGTSSATDVSPVRPGPWMGVDLTVEGRVQLLAPRLFERATAGDGSVGETASDGVTVWGRSAPGADALTGVSLQTLYTLPPPTPAKVGALLLPQWLTSASGAADAGTDDLGRPTFRATLPAGVLGTIEDGQAPVDAVIVLTLDEAGDPAHLEVSTTGGPPLRLAYDIAGIGDEMPIQLPGEASATAPGSTGTPGSTSTPGSTGAGGIPAG
jgi:hypothetical protein